MSKQYNFMPKTLKLKYEEFKAKEKRIRKEGKLEYKPTKTANKNMVT